MPPSVSTRNSPIGELVVPDPRSVAFDEDPSEATASQDEAQDSNTKAREMLDVVGDICDKIPEQAYIDLCNLSSDFSKLERREARLRQYILEIEGSECSILAPSDDNDDLPVVDALSDSDDWSSLSDNGCECEFDGQNVHSSCASSVQSDRPDEIPDAAQSAKNKSVAPSGLLVYSKGQYFSVPMSAVKRGGNDTIPMDSEKIIELTRPKNRAKTWNTLFPNGTLDPTKIVVLQMKLATPITDDSMVEHTTSFFWGVIFQPSRPRKDDHRVVWLLPETTCWQVTQNLLSSPQTENSSLVKKWQPCMLREPDWTPCCPVRSVPIAGPSRQARRSTPCAETKTGNYWPVSKRVKTTVHPMSPSVEEA